MDDNKQSATTIPPEILNVICIAAIRAYQADTYNVDVQENDILRLHPELLNILLKDRTTGHNIMWCTDDYAELGKGYGFKDEITAELITGEHGDVIRPRSVKSKEEQQSRTRDKAEVMTPTWICNKMNNLADEAWFGRKDVFNVENGKTWTPVAEKIAFPNPKEYGPKSWMDYLASKRLEITCGEAPYLVSRYDAVTGEAVPIDRRIGLLDRKLRIVNERVRNMKDRKRTKKRWFDLAKLAMQSIYGFEWQGDNVLLARENVLLTLVDYYRYKFDGDDMPVEWLKEFADIISWNIWQMDGIKCVVPETCHRVILKRRKIELDLFNAKSFKMSAKAQRQHEEYLQSKISDMEEIECPGCRYEKVGWHSGKYCMIKNWSTGKIFKYSDNFIKNEVDNMDIGKNKKWTPDVVLGNPPYQAAPQLTSQQKNFSPPVYHKFLDSAYSVCDKVLMIHPARFLYNAGATPKEWNEKMLADEHIKIMSYTPDSREIFGPNVTISGGIVITYRDAKKEFGAINVFTPFNELNSILNKVVNVECFKSFDEIIYIQTRLALDLLYKDHPEYKVKIGSNGKDSRLERNIFEKIGCFTNEQKESDDIKILGIENRKRTWKYIKRSYIDLSHENLFSYKVIMSTSNGAAGNLGKEAVAICGEPEISVPGEGYTRTFLGIGAFPNQQEAINCSSYIKTRFCRCMLGVLKATQLMNKDVWHMIPLQDFSPASDIDWSKSISEIDAQLYKKYSLTDEEIAFIEKNVKEMA